MRPRVAITAELPGHAVEHLGKSCDVRINTSGKMSDEDAMIEFIGSADAVLTLLANPVTDRVLAACPKLQVVGNCAVGFDNIDLEAARRRGVWVTNTARGPLVDEVALVRVLEDGHLGGAGLDVFEDEPAVHPGLLERENVFLLPHIGSATKETRAAMAELAATNILAVLAGDEPPTPVVRP